MRIVDHVMSRDMLGGGELGQLPTSAVVSICQPSNFRGYRLPVLPIATVEYDSSGASVGPLPLVRPSRS